MDTTVHKPADKTWVSMYTIAPLGDGTAVLLSNYYKSMLLSVQSDSLVVNDTPVAISVERVPGYVVIILWPPKSTDMWPLAVRRSS